MTFSVTIVFIALLALIQIPMTIVVGMYRQKSGIQFLDGGDEILTRRMRAHGNFTETVPITLLAMGAAEYAGAPQNLLLVGGVMLLLGRLAHYFTLYRVGSGNGRAIGMLLTIAALALFSISCLAAIAGLFG